MPLPINSLAMPQVPPASPPCFCSPAAAKAEEDVWPTLKQQTFGDRAIAEDGMVVLEAPDTAEDAALVPLTVRVPPQVTQNLKSLTLVIDKNPDPVIATLSFGPAAGTGGERSFSTRVRIDSFSHVRAMLETEDGSLHMATKFVAGGRRLRGDERQGSRHGERGSRQDDREDLPARARRQPDLVGAGDAEASQQQRHAARHRYVRLHPGALRQGDDGEARRRARVQAGRAPSRSRPTRISASPSDAAATTASTWSSPTPTARCSPRQSKPTGS